MRLDITNWDTDHNVSLPKAIEWLNTNLGVGDYTKNFQVFADTWRIYREENSVEGFYESTYWLEFDREQDATAFLLRWS